MTAYDLDWVLAQSLDQWDAMSLDERGDFPSYAHFVLAWSSGALTNMLADGVLTADVVELRDAEVKRYVYDQLMSITQAEAQRMAREAQAPEHVQRAAADAAQSALDAGGSMDDAARAGVRAAEAAMEESS